MFNQKYEAQYHVASGAVEKPQMSMSAAVTVTASAACMTNYHCG